MRAALKGRRRAADINGEVRTAERQEALERVRAELAAARPASILDAGAGQSSRLAAPHGVRLTGLDVSAEELARNPALDERLVGDLQTYPLPRERFDAAVCWYVLEHLPRPRAALTNLAACLRPGGLLIVCVPIPSSLKGLLTKLTPHRFHVWAYSRLLGSVDTPFRTYLRREIEPRRLERFARDDLGLEPVQSMQVASGIERSLPAPLRAIFRAASLARPLSGGRYDPLLDEYLAVFRKPAANTGSVRSAAA